MRPRQVEQRAEIVRRILPDAGRDTPDRHRLHLEPGAGCGQRRIRIGDGHLFLSGVEPNDRFAAGLNGHGPCSPYPAVSGPTLESRQDFHKRQVAVCNPFGWKKHPPDRKRAPTSPEPFLSLAGCARYGLTGSSSSESMMMIAAMPASKPASPMSQLELPSSPLAPRGAEVARAAFSDCAAEAAIGVITIVAAVNAKAVFLRRPMFRLH